MTFLKSEEQFSPFCGLLGHEGSLGYRPHWGLNNHTSERDTTLLPKTLRLWVLLLIRCSTFTLLFAVEHITHTCTQHSPSSVSPSIHHAPPSSGSIYLHISPLLVSPQRIDTVPLLLLSAQMDWLPWSYPLSNGARIPLLGHEGSLGDRPRRGLNNHTSERDTTLLPKTLRLWVYGSSYL